MRLAFLVPAVLALPVNLHAQAAMTGGVWTTERTSFEAFIGTWTDGGSHADARGARVLFRLSEPRDSAIPLASRAWLGVFAVRGERADEAQPVRGTHLGIQLDVRPLVHPIAGRIEPIVSFGVGAHHMERAVASRVLPEDDRARRATLVRRLGIDQSERTAGTNFAITPGVGARLRLWSGFALRADLRNALVFGDGARHNMEFSGGFSFGQ